MDDAPIVTVIIATLPAALLFTCMYARPLFGELVGSTGPMPLQLTAYAVSANATGQFTVCGPHWSEEPLVVVQGVPVVVHPDGQNVALCTIVAVAPLSTTLPLASMTTP